MGTARRFGRWNNYQISGCRAVRMLAVEDDPRIREVVAEARCEEGYAMIPAASGESALL
jgi:DNA-binding NtrC family response regulator